MLCLLVVEFSTAVAHCLVRKIDLLWDLYWIVSAMLSHSTYRNVTLGTLQLCEVTGIARWQTHSVGLVAYLALFVPPLS